MIFVGLFIIHRLPSIYLIALKSTPATRHGVGDNPLYIRPVRASLAEVHRPQGIAMPLILAAIPAAAHLSPGEVCFLHQLFSLLVCLTPSMAEALETSAKRAKTAGRLEGTHWTQT